jgi:NTP pyrophosphatase (non-canonical NTP hydrolase)
MGDVTNEDRAGWAEVACEAFAEITGQDIENDLPEIIGDLIANLMHLANQQGMSVEDRLENARMHYDAEIEEEEEEYAND